MKILVADSLNGNLRAIKRLLEKEGHEVTTTQIGEKVLELLDSIAEKDLLIIDLDLSGRIQGPELVKKIMELRPNQAWMMIGSSWVPEIRDRQKFLEKPYDNESLIEAIQNATKDP